ncbi:hypothetical protein [Calothrix sp. 336/3]|uniref:hypothetical protein n=1 Tax=Calothrix sp. 336/3 TaxID=1337936 RepID=UPI001EDECAEB|nr:hypothetical protein [Calothrix sp. 336/3]
MEYALVVSYVLMTGYFLINWLRFSLRSVSSSPENTFLSLTMVVMTLLWPLAIPASMVKVLRTKKFEFGAVMPLILAVSAFSVAFYMT